MHNNKKTYLGKRLLAISVNFPSQIPVRPPRSIEGMIANIDIKNTIVTVAIQTRKINSIKLVNDSQPLKELSAKIANTH
jgi:hypothetical protein